MSTYFDIFCLLIKSYWRYVMIKALPAALHCWLTEPFDIATQNVIFRVIEYISAFFRYIQLSIKLLILCLISTSQEYSWLFEVTDQNCEVLGVVVQWMGLCWHEEYKVMFCYLHFMHKYWKQLIFTKLHCTLCYVFLFLWQHFRFSSNPIILRFTNP